MLIRHLSRNRVLILCCLCSGALRSISAAFAVPPTYGDPSSGELFIGMTLPSGKGEDERGEELRAGALIGIDKINRAGGIKGKMVRLRTKDSGEDARVQVQAFTDLIQDGDVSVVITSEDKEAENVRALSDNRHVLVLSNSLSFDPLRKGELTIKVGPSLTGAHETLTHFMEERRITRLALLIGDAGWADQGVEHLNLLSEAGKFKIVARERISSTEGQLHRDAPTILARANPELIYVVGDLKDQVSAMELLDGNQITTPFMHLFVCKPKLSPIIRDYKGLHYSLDSALNAEGGDLDSIRQRFANRFPMIDFSSDAATAFDLVTMTAEAYKAGAETAESIRDYFLKQKEYSGIVGKLTFLPGGDSKRSVSVSTVGVAGCTELKLEHSK